MDKYIIITQPIQSLKPFDAEGPLELCKKLQEERKSLPTHIRINGDRYRMLRDLAIKYMNSPQRPALFGISIILDSGLGYNQYIIVYADGHEEQKYFVTIEEIVERYSSPLELLPLEVKDSVR